MYLCTNDRYTAITEPFVDLEDFQAMCVACFGQEADLHPVGDDYYDETGMLVLERVS